MVPMRRSSRLLPGAITIVAALLLAAAGAGAQEGNSEGSIEVGFWKRVSERGLLYVPVSITRADATDHAEGLAGVGYDLALDSTLSLRAGYRYIWELSPAEGVQPYREHRAIGELFARPWPGAKLEMVDRVRLEIRWAEDGPTWRLRNRVRLGSVIPLRRVISVMPYGTLEATYDSRYRSINRLRFSLGAAMRFNRKFGLDVYAARQRDTRSDAAKLASAGATVNVFF
jgi:hypothetical protein